LKNNFSNNAEVAKKLDEEDSLKSFRELFEIPKIEGTENTQLYFAGHSLGLMPKTAKTFINEELDEWARLGVEGHFKARHPWLPYHENLTNQMAKVVGGKASEVVVMNTLTVNLHLMMVSFYRPTKKRFKILIENNTFPSDQYAVDSQAKFHGFDPKEAIIELTPNSSGMTVDTESILDTIEKNKDSLALVMLGNSNYLSGQSFDFEKITKKAHENDIPVGFNLAHGAGNLLLNLHDWDVDFAVWCSYKYLNSGPGGLAGAFVHEKHHGKENIPRFEGWWGHNKEERFLMGRTFNPINSVEAWQLSNPPIFQMASLMASLEIFDKATMPALRKKGDLLTAYLEYLVLENCGDFCEIITPGLVEGQQTRGSMLCIRMKKDPKKLVKEFVNNGVICDFREPDILRMTPIPLYNNFTDVYKLVEIIKEFS
jgi:kynureninase